MSEKQRNKTKNKIGFNNNPVVATKQLVPTDQQ
jgi:hypothetical protein